MIFCETWRKFLLRPWLAELCYQILCLKNHSTGFCIVCSISATSRVSFNDTSRKRQKFPVMDGDWKYLRVSQRKKSSSKKQPVIYYLCSRSWGQLLLLWQLLHPVFLYWRPCYLTGQDNQELCWSNANNCMLTGFLV